MAANNKLKREGVAAFLARQPLERLQEISAQIRIEKRERAANVDLAQLQRDAWSKK